MQNDYQKHLLHEADRLGNILLMSIHKRHLDNLMNGTKRFEFRKVCPTQIQTENLHILFVVPSSEGWSSALAKVDCIMWDTPENVWKDCCKYPGISKEEFDAYYKGKEKAVAYHIDRIDDCVVQTGCKTPKSFLYWNGIWKKSNCKD